MVPVVPKRHHWEKNHRHRHRHCHHYVPCRCVGLPILAAVLFCLVALPSLLFQRSYSNQKHRTFLPPEQQRLRQVVPPSISRSSSQPQPLPTPVVVGWIPPPKNYRVDDNIGVIKNGTESSALASSPSSSSRYLIFRPPLEAAQGVGNLMNGLLAAHLLGEEFHRIVCVSQDWRAFATAFESLVPECQSQSDEQRITIPPRTSQNTIWLLNFSKNPINECDLKQKLQASDHPAIYFVANTYPGWPTTTTTNCSNSSSSNSSSSSSEYPNHRIRIIRVEDFYRLKPDLLKFIPWSEAPKTVVHLREADNTNQGGDGGGGGDHRVGLDPATLARLGATLPRDTYLVTNQLDFYSYFETNFGWSHPPWTGTIRHSAIASVQWTHSSSSSSTTSSVVNRTGAARTSALARTRTSATANHEQTLQLWADWWTIYKGQTVYHTHSDFSASAVKWSPTVLHSYELNGLDERADLVMKRQHQETWRCWDSTTSSYPNERGNITVVVLPLSRRSDDLKHCDVIVDSWKSKNSGLGYVLDLDDEMHDDLVDDWKNKQPQQEVSGTNK